MSGLIDQAVQEAACVVVTEYDKTHLTHDVAYEDVASAIDQLRLVLLGRDHPGLRPEYRALIDAAPRAAPSPALTREALQRVLDRLEQQSDAYPTADAILTALGTPPPAPTSTREENL